MIYKTKENFLNSLNEESIQKGIKEAIKNQIKT